MSFHKFSVENCNLLRIAWRQLLVSQLLGEKHIKLLKSWEKVVYFFRIWKILGTYPILLHGERGLGRLHKLTPLSLPNDIRGHTASARFVPLRGLCQCSDRSEQWVKRHIWCLWSKYISLRIYTTNYPHSKNIHRRCTHTHGTLITFYAHTHTPRKKNHHKNTYPYYMKQMPFSFLGEFLHRKKHVF